MDTVLFQWKRSPTVDATQSHLYLVNTHIGVVCLRYKFGVSLVFLYSVVK